VTQRTLSHLSHLSHLSRVFTIFLVFLLWRHGTDLEKDWEKDLVSQLVWKGFGGTRGCRSFTICVAASSWFTGATTSSAQISTILIYFCAKVSCTCVKLNKWSLWSFIGCGTLSSSAQVGSCIWTDMISLLSYLSLQITSHWYHQSFATCHSPSEEITPSAVEHILPNWRSSLNQLSQAEYCEICEASTMGCDLCQIYP
jgi:hypothetical protein